MLYCSMCVFVRVCVLVRAMLENQRTHFTCKVRSHSEARVVLFDPHIDDLFICQRCFGGFRLSLKKI